MPDAAAACDSCRAERALLHCRQHDARLCLTCDLAAHRHAHDHQRAPLCDGCHAAPAVARSDAGPFCEACARDGERQCRRTAATYTGVPNQAEMARILDAPLPSPSPPPPPVTEEAWIDDALLLPYDNYPEVLNSMMFQDSNTGMGKETMTGTTTAGEEALLIDNANQPDYFQAWTNSFDSVALMEPGALQEPSYFDLEPSYLNFESCLLGTDQQMASSMQPDSADLLQPLNMSDTPYVQLPMMDTNLNNDIGATPLPSNLVELIPQPDVSLLQPLTMNDTLQPLTMNETTYDQLPMIDTNTSNDASSDFTCANFQSSSTSLLPGGNSCQDQQAHCVELPKKPCPDPEQRQRAVQRYKQKRNNRRFVKQIMYASRKATADTRRRVRGRFVKASLEQGSSSNDNKQPNHEPD